MAMDMKLRMVVCMLIGFSLSVAASAHAGVVDVRDVENPAHTPFVINTVVNFEPSGSITELGEVPAGKRAVIEFISMQCATVPPDTIRSVEFFFRNAQVNGSIHYFLPISKQGDPGDFLQQSWVAGQLVRIYADEGSIGIVLTLSSQTPGGSSGCEVSISGHTIDVK
jgi:hypothetical protein